MGNSQRNLLSIFLYWIITATKKQNKKSSSGLEDDFGRCARLMVIRGLQQGRSFLLGFRRVEFLVDGRELLVEGVWGLHLHGRQRLGVLLVYAAEHGNQAQSLAEFALGICTKTMPATLVKVVFSVAQSERKRGNDV